MKDYLMEFKSIGDKESGFLVALEQDSQIPFKTKRVYYIYDVPKQMQRGFHAHKNLQQVAICVKGLCDFLLDDGMNQKNYLLDNPKTGLFIDKMIWHEMGNFSKDCVLMMLASELYDEGDYIRKYEDFKKIIEI